VGWLKRSARDRSERAWGLGARCGRYSRLRVGEVVAEA
jgi:hypothetical protein